MHQHMCGGFRAVSALTRITPKEYKTFYGEITPSRVQFCELLQPAQLQILSDILPTDLAHFTRDGINNTRFCHRRPQQNPQGVVQSNFQHRLPVSVWYRILGKYIRGLHVIELLSDV
jgi:hypothetical protein